jgi:hypothetical protein
MMTAGSNGPHVELLRDLEWWRWPKDHGIAPDTCDVSLLVVDEREDEDRRSDRIPEPTTHA